MGILRAIIAILFFFMAVPGWSAVYYVNATGGDDSRNAATAQNIATPWATIGKCNSTMAAGDTCLVRAGTYAERIAIGQTDATNYTTYAAFAGEAVIMQGFSLASKSHVNIIGFTITGNAAQHGIVLTGSCSYINILYNNLHHTYGNAIRTYQAGATHSYITVRGNTAYWPGCVTEGSNCPVMAFLDNAKGCDHYLVEYNTVHRAGDFIDLYGQYNIQRNNYFYDYDDSYTTGSPAHVDFFQNGSDGISTSTRFHIFESNFMGDNVEANSHVFQFRDTVADGDTDLTVRGNVAYNVGSYFMMAGGVNNVRAYNNTGYAVLGGGFSFNTEGADGSDGSHDFNNLLSSAPGVFSHQVEAGSSVTLSNNLCYNTNSHASCVSTADPVFGNAATKDFTIQTSSPAKNTGKAITTVNNADGSGTTVTLADAGFFTDGYGLTTGDKIKVGTNDPTTITNITGNAVTVADSITWTNGDGVYWRNQDTQPDIGAYEYKADGYTLTGTWALADGTVTVTPNDATLVRFVEVFEDGVSKGTDFTSPYTVGGIGAGTVTVKIYSLYASATPVVNATESGVTEYTLTVTTPTNGKIATADGYINCGSGGISCSHSYASTESAVISFTPDSGYRTVSSSGSCSGASGPQTIAMSEARTCAATFEKGMVLGSGNTLTLGTGNTITLQ